MPTISSSHAAKSTSRKRRVIAKRKPPPKVRRLASEPRVGGTMNPGARIFQPLKVSVTNYYLVDAGPLDGPPDRKISGISGAS